MSHGTATPRPRFPDPKEARISQLSHEYLTADAARRAEIGVEVAGLIAGQIAALPLSSNVTSLPARS